MSIADYLIQMGPKTPNPTADALERWAATQAPQLTPNYARSAQQASLQTGGPFAGLVSGILGFKAASTDAKNAQAAQQQSAQQDLASRLINWGREDEVAQRNRNWSKADQLEAWSRQHQKDLWERENKTADKLEAWAREKETAERNRDWALADRKAAWEREDNVAQRNRNWTVADKLMQQRREDAKDYLDKMAPIAAKNLTAQDYQSFLINPERSVNGPGWLGRKLGNRGNLGDVWKPSAQKSVVQEPSAAETTAGQEEEISQISSPWTLFNPFAAGKQLQQLRRLSKQAAPNTPATGSYGKMSDDELLGGI